MADTVPYYVCNQLRDQMDMFDCTEELNDALMLKIEETLAYETYDELTGDEYADAVLSTLSWLSAQPVP